MMQLKRKGSITSDNWLLIVLIVSVMLAMSMTAIFSPRGKSKSEMQHELDMIKAKTELLKAQAATQPVKEE